MKALVFFGLFQFDSMYISDIYVSYENFKSRGRVLQDLLFSNPKTIKNVTQLW